MFAKINLGKFAWQEASKGSKPAATASENGKSAHCTRCGCERSFIKCRTRHLLHFLATLLTAGVWLIVWVTISIERAMRPWRCEKCGWHKPEFSVPLREALQMGQAALYGSRRQSAIRMIRRDHVEARPAHIELERDK